MMGLGVKNPIREKELQRLKNSIKIGDRINVKTLKVSQGRHASGATSAMAVVRGTVIAKYPHLVLVVLSSGLMESATWAGAGGAEERKKQERQMMDK